MKIISHIYTAKSLALVFIDSQGKLQNKIVDNTHLNWPSMEKAYKKGDLKKVIQLSDVSSAIHYGFEGKFTVKNGNVYANDELVTGYLFDRIIFFLENGLPYKRLLEFAKNLWSNPSEKARKDLYKFLEHGNFPLTDNGTFIAYKGVQSDYFSITGGSLKLIKGKTNREGKIFNGIGEEIEVDRSAVNPNQNQTCSYGLHAGSYSYANQFKKDGRLVLVEINPRDVVSIPSDANSQKLRCCKYTVIGEVGQGGAVNAPLDDSDVNIVDKVSYHNKRDASGRFTKKKGK